GPFTSGYPSRGRFSGCRGWMSGAQVARTAGSFTHPSRSRGCSDIGWDSDGSPWAFGGVGIGWDPPLGVYAGGVGPGTGAVGARGAVRGRRPAPGARAGR